MRSVYVLRKPCAESSVSANSVRFGVGGLNIDGTRVGAEGAESLPKACKAPGWVDVGLASDLKGDLDAGLLTGDTSGHATVLHVQMFPIRTQEIQFLDTTPYIVRSLSVWVPSAGMTLTKKEMIAAVREQVGRILSRYAFTDIHATLSKRTPVITSGTFAGEDGLEIRLNVVVYVHPRGASAPKFTIR